MFLSDGQTAAALLKLSVVAFGQFGDKIMCMYCLCGGDDLIVCRVELPVGDIFADSSRKEEIVLRHDAHLLPQALDADFFDILPINPYTALLDIVEAADQVYDRGLSGACRPHKGDCLAGVDVEAHII